MNPLNFRAQAARINLLCLLLSFCGAGLLGQNYNALHFDGVDDSLTVPIQQLPVAALDTFSLQFWFLAEEEVELPLCGDGARTLFALSNATNSLAVINCDDNLYLSRDAATGPGGGLQLFGQETPGNWQHISAVVVGDTIIISLDCTESLRMPTDLNGTPEALYISSAYTSASFGSGRTWLGEIEEFQLWTGVQRLGLGCSDERCPPDSNHPDLLVYYNFNQGAAAGANTGIGAVENQSSTPNVDGVLHNFSLTGPTSNFVASNAPLQNEVLVNLPFEIRDYPYQAVVLDSICSGDPVTFCLGPNGPPMGLMSTTVIDWEFSDDFGISWTQLQSPPFTDYCFPVPPNGLTADCASNSQGFIDRLFRANIRATEQGTGNICNYQSETDTLRIRCAVTDPVVTINPGGPLCAEDSSLLTVTLQTAHQWLDPLGADTEINWTISAPAEPTLMLTDELNETTFTYPFSAPALSAPKTFTFTAVVTSCTGAASFSASVTVDPEPIAGDIIGLPVNNPRNLTEVFPPDNPVYDICPGEDATIGVRPFMEPMFCIPQWQYTFDLNGTVIWQDLGFSNSSQNTNILPSNQWPTGADRIYYRYRCDPENQPSGCEPAFSDTLEIRLRALPTLPQITGPTDICLGDNVVLTLATMEPGIDYYWYLDGLQVAGPATSYSTDVGGNFQVVADNGCELVEGPLFRVDEIEVVPAMSCPLQPNNCLTPGDEVILNATASFVTGSPNPQLTYSWSASSGETGTGDTFSYTAHPNTTPPLTPTTVMLTVTDMTTGCANTISRTITPCGNRF